MLSPIRNINLNPIYNYFNSYQVNSSLKLKSLNQDTFERNNVSFTSCDTTNFQIKNVANLRCPVCGLIMLTEEQINDFCADVANKKGIELAKTLEKYEDDSIFTGVKKEPKIGIYRPQQQQVVDIYKQLALENPNLSLRELTQKEAKKRIKNLIDVQMDVVDELENYVRQSNIGKKDKKRIGLILDEQKKRIYGTSNDHFSRKQFIDSLSNVTWSKRAQQDIIEIASKLPTSETEINSFFIKYARAESSVVIASRLVSQTIPTAEHLVPRSLNGINGAKNYLCDCADCNRRRDITSFYKWQQEIPNFKNNLQLHLEEIQEAIDKGILSKEKYSKYIKDIILTIRSLSKNEIVLDLPENFDEKYKDEAHSKRKKK